MLERIQHFLQEMEIMKKIQSKFNFEIPNYVLKEMIAPTPAFPLYVNIAVLNNRLSKENGTYLKQQVMY